ncbi:MAG: hypothetical protein IKF64_07070, partial [Eubacterium sp.]|nr:hypothetical protein [Eubacterium sp.]
AITPPSCKIGANNALEAMGATVAKQNQKESIKLWKKGLKDFDITEFRIKIITTPELENGLKQVLQGVQSGIGSVVRNGDDDKIYTVFEIKTMSEAEIKNAKIKGDYDIALCPFRATSDSAVSFLRATGENSGGYNKKKLEKSLVSAEKAADINTKTKFVREAEGRIIGSYSLYPVIYETGYYVEAKGVEGVQFHMGTGRVSFVNATRKE